MKTLLWANVMPLAAVSLVTLLLSLSIDPATQSLALDLSGNQQTGPVSSLSLPAILQNCTGSSLYVGGGSRCTGGLAFSTRGVHANNDSVDMSYVLLKVAYRSILVPIHQG